MRILSCSVFIVLLGGLLAACGSNPVDGDHEEHFEPELAELLINGEAIVTLSPDNLDHENVFVRDTIEVSAGSATPPIGIRFFDDDGDEVAPEDDEDVRLDVATEDATVAMTELDEDDEWVFHVVGERVGNTVLSFAVMHGGDHEDFGTYRIPVSIVESGGRHDGEAHDHDGDE